MNLRALLFVAPIALMSSGGLCQDYSFDAGSVLSGCIDALRIGGEMNDKIKAGFCIGAVNTLVVLSGTLPDKYRFCPPPGTDSHVTMNAVIAYIQKPRRWNEPFERVALEGLREKWPCGRIN